MLKSIKLVNFQSHKDTTIPFHAGVNALVGLSDSGKTAILRALSWVITNKPSGDEFRSNWGGDTSVELELDNKIVITRAKTNNDNYYHIRYADGAGQYFRAFGQNVPQEIQDALNMSDINISSQMDAPFLLSSSSGEVAQILNKVANLDVIDRAISNIRSKKLSIDRSFNEAQGNVVSLEDKLKEYSYLDAMEQDVLQLEQVRKVLSAYTQRKSAISRLSTQALALQDTLQKFNGIVAAEDCLQLALSLKARHDQASAQVKALSAIIRKIAETDDKIANIYGYEGAEELIAGASKFSQAMSKVVNDIETLQSLIKAVNTKQRLINLAEATIEELTIEFNESLPEVCPLCGGHK